jgi:enamine deaminase RidA (YjgF/YER057c/UK114 family)
MFFVNDDSMSRAVPRGAARNIDPGRCTDMSTIDTRLAELGIVLPAPLILPSHNRTSAVLVDRTLYLSGHGAALLEDTGVKRRGKVTVGLTADDAYAVSRALAIKMLATVRHHVGNLDRVRRVVKLVGFINAPATFEKPNAVLNGASDLMFDVFGPEIGCHARSSLVVASLVDDQPVEIEGIFAV